MQNFLQSKGLGKFITDKGKQLLENPLLSADKKAVLEDNDEMALGQIKVNIATSYLDIVAQAKTALEAWNALQAFFEGKETFNKVYLLEQLWEGKLEESGNLMENIQIFIRDKTDVARRLENAGVKFEDDVIAAITLSRLPPSFDTMVRILTSQKELSVAKVKEELQREAIRRNVMRAPETAFSANTNSTDSRGKKRPADESEDTREPKKPKLDKSKLVCSYCDFKGHTASACWLNPESKYFRANFKSKLLKAVQSTGSQK
jgi:hypothetical protein